MNQLDDYFDAYDQAHVLATQTDEWKSLRRSVRRTMSRPVIELGCSVAFMLLCVLVGYFSEVVTGYFLALGTVLAVIPPQLRRIKEKRAAIANLVEPQDLRKHLLKEARVASAGVFIDALMYVLFAILFLFTGTVAWFLSKDPSPGLISGLVMFALGAFTFFVQFPKASRIADDLNPQDAEEEQHNES